MLPEATLDQARNLLAQMDAKRMTLATAESCTGGLIAAALTAIAGSSSVVMAGFVTYSNDAKQKMVGVSPESLSQHGAVSAEVARAMAEGARARAGVSLALSCTGIAGPGGATPGKPVGLVFIGCARDGASTLVERHVFPGDRAAVREATVAAALDLARRSVTGG
ncbi:MAG: nicotinamide-nucleotide amidohydrolase family protein [Roseomonas sp.]|nr:nicotinamide-nucleotide amidohydrolase family protein [Roseomonas sp.]